MYCLSHIIFKFANDSEHALKGEKEKKLPEIIVSDDIG
jgi:hypothetical protein